jgi:hypothetical protein
VPRHFRSFCNHRAQLRVGNLRASHESPAGRCDFVPGEVDTHDVRFASVELLNFRKERKNMKPQKSTELPEISDQGKLNNFSINGRTYQRLLKKGHKRTLWRSISLEGERRKVAPETQQCIERQWRKHKNHTNSIVVRFPRRKRHFELFDGHNLTWENLPRFDPEEVADTNWLIQSFLPETGVHLLYGAEGSCKSTLMLYAGKCIAEGIDFFGMKVTQRRVLVLDYENPSDVLKLRANDLDLKLPENPNFAIWNRFTEIIFHPSDSRLKDLVRGCVRETGAGPIIIIDSWSSVLKSGEGGETTGHIAPLYAHFRKLVDLGATVIVIDHTNKDGTALYGGADKKAKSDSRHRFMGPDKNGFVKVKSTLKRYSPETSDEFSFKICGYRDKSGFWRINRLKTVTDAKKEEETRKIEYVCKLIKEKGKDGKEALLDKAVEDGHSRGEITKILESTTDKWEMYRAQAGKHVYRLL